MNLGVIYLSTAAVILVAAMVLGAIATEAFLSLRQKRSRLSTHLFGALVVGLPLACLGLATCHQTLFSTWHRQQNVAVPKEGCLTYEPSFWHLYASYQMDRPSFDAWVASHPWRLEACEQDGLFLQHDGPHFGLTSCEAVYESPPTEKGNNLRVYYDHGVVYLSYSAM